jgi:hypothetical protein
MNRGDKRARPNLRKLHSCMKMDDGDLTTTLVGSIKEGAFIINMPIQINKFPKKLGC